LGVSGNRHTLFHFGDLLSERSYSACIENFLPRYAGLAGPVQYQRTRAAAFDGRDPFPWFSVFLQCTIASEKMNEDERT